MYPEDRVLVGVINRKRDFDKARDEHWYRVPQGEASKGIHAEYIAFFFSKAFKELNGGIYYYARRTGVELVHRRDLLPNEASHKRADALYHKLQLGELRRKEPPILNPSHRSISFIYTTWDRFEQARVVADLYSEADLFVDRVFHVLEDAKIPAERLWQVQSDDGGAQIRVICENGLVIASTAARTEHVISLDLHHVTPQASAALIRQAVEAHGGPRLISIPIEG